jgi:hypothetical protein
MRRASAALVLLLAAGCDYDPRGRCESARECLDGQLCSGGVCASPGPSPANHAPSAGPDAFVVPASGELLCAAPCLLANDVDPDGDPLVAEPVVTPPAHGVAFVEPSGAFRYLRTEAGYAGADSFQYRASDGALPSPVVTVTLGAAP